jgi:hypothetical protein
MFSLQIMDLDLAKVNENVYLFSSLAKLLELLLLHKYWEQG